MRRSTVLLVFLAASLAFTTACSSARRDDAIATEIKAKMFSDPQLKDASLQVAVHQGQATLTGSVTSDAARYEAYKLATETQGVSKVNDQMSVQVAQAMPAPELALAPDPAPKPRPRALKHAAIAENSVAPAPAPAGVPAPTPAVAAPPPSPPPPQPQTVDIPAGTTIAVRMIDGIDSSVNHTGEVFQASLDEPLVSGDRVIVPRGENVYVRLVQASSAGHMSGRSELRLELVKLDFQGKSYPLVSSTYDQHGTSRGKRTAATVGGGAALGALIGAVAGGGKGAAIGAGVGAASGGVYQGVTKGQQVRIPPETKLDFRLEQPVTLTFLPKKRSSDQ